MGVNTKRGDQKKKNWEQNGEQIMKLLTDNRLVGCKLIFFLLCVIFPLPRLVPRSLFLVLIASIVFVETAE